VSDWLPWRIFQYTAQQREALLSFLECGERRPHAPLPQLAGAPMVQMKNKISVLLIESGVSYKKQGLLNEMNWDAELKRR
jgi:hypothetical protein